MHGIFVSIKKVLSLPDGCIGWCRSRAVSVHYSLSSFPSIPTAVTFPHSQPLSLYHINASSKATFQVSAICVIQTPSDTFCCLDESMYQRNFLLTWDQEGQRVTDPSLLFYEMLGPVACKENCCIEFFVSFSGPLKVTILYPCDHFWRPSLP